MTARVVEFPTPPSKKGEGTPITELRPAHLLDAMRDVLKRRIELNRAGHLHDVARRQ